MRRVMSLAGLFFCFSTTAAWASVEGSISGTVTDPQGVAVSNATIKVVTSAGKTVKEVKSSMTGDFQIFPLTLGDYEVFVEMPEYAPYHESVHVSSGANTGADIHLAPKSAGKEMVLEVKAKRRLIQNTSATSSSEVNQDQIAALPQGNEISLPKLLTDTTPGAVPGPFGQVFFRGNHANIQYQIDGVQLPDSPSNTFGEAFSPRNIDHMEVITGGIPAEYGERLAAVVNIVSKSGPETPGGDLELNYGTYNTTSPHLLFGGSNESGSLHYFLSANYHRTDRGLDTPQPVSEADQTQGGTDAIHDVAYGNSEMAKIDWLADNDNKVSFIFFNAQNHFQIPNYPGTFKYTDPYFQPGFSDQFGNGGTAGATTFNFVPSITDDTQAETNAYAQVVWKHTFSDKSFMQLAPYYKYSAITVTNDPVNDLATSGSGATPITGSSPSSFAEDRHVNNLGLKGDWTYRPNDLNLVKAGFQLQASRAEGPISVQTDLATPPSTDNSPDNGFFESLYLQDDLSVSKALTFNVGLRFDATQFAFAGINPTDNLLQPRVGVNYMVTDTTKVHAFYGKLFQPAPVENLRDTFISTGAGQLSPYDIKAEKDDYYEVGIAQQIGNRHAAIVNAYYKDATNMLDDAQLLNTSIAQPYNFAHGYAYGVEFSIKGQINDDWSDFLNYSYEIAKGQGISGGIFAFSSGQQPSNNYTYLDHVQIHTANAGVTYKKDRVWWSTQGLFGSGLRTGPDNSLGLPAHFTADTSVGYDFHGDSWLSKFKLSGDVLNIFNNVYPITIANGFNGSHYAAEREFFVRLTKDL